MYQSKLIYLLRGLTPDEFKRFRKFLKSPIFNSNATPVKLYDAIQRYYPHFDSPKLGRERVYKKMFPDKEYHYHRMGNYMTEFTQLLESYFIFLEKEGDEFDNKKTLTRALGKRNYYDLFEKRALSLIEDLNRKPYRDVSYYQEISKLKSDFFFHPKTNRYTLERDFPKEISEDLDKAFVLQKMQIANELKGREKMLSAQYDIQFLKETMNYAKRHYSEESPLFFIYRNILSLYADPNNEKVFFELKSHFEIHLEKIKRKEQKDILQHLLNHSSGQVNKGKLKFYEPTLSLYKTGLNNFLIIENDLISETSFMNIVSIAIGLKNYEWTEYFIKNYDSYLSAEVRPYMKAYSLGALRFNQGKLDSAIEILHNQRFSKILHETNTRFLLMKVWYEKFLQDETVFDLLNMQIEAFDKFLRRKEVLSSPRTKGYLNFLKTVRKMVAFKTNLKNTPEQIRKMNSRLEEMKFVYGKVWLTEKIKEL